MLTPDTNKTSGQTTPSTPTQAYAYDEVKFPPGKVRLGTINSPETPVYVPYMTCIFVRDNFVVENEVVFIDHLLVFYLV